MGVFYLFHEHFSIPGDLGKTFARTAIIGMIVYYVLYFIVPLYVGVSEYIVFRWQHFLRRLIFVDILASSIFYGGLIGSIAFWSTGPEHSEGGPGERGPEHSEGGPGEGVPKQLEESEQSTEEFSDDEK